MRARQLLLVLAVVAVAAFTYQNWGEFTRTSTLWLGPFGTQAPLGLTLLVLLGLGLIAYLMSMAAVRTRALMESRQHHKTLEAQRDLADKAEASRFTDLRTHLDASQRELRTELVQMNSRLMARLSEVENRLDTRTRSGGNAGWTQPAGVVSREDELRAEHAAAAAKADHVLAQRRDQQVEDVHPTTSTAAAPERERAGGLFRNWR